MKDTIRQGFAYHADLVERMAATQGLNLTEELEAGRISFTGLDDAVHRCMQCSDPEGCQLWLDNHEGGSHSSPEICQNRGLFKRLG
ncbi:hypothetical protein XMM379_001031 [Aliiroseovarius sp. xm-m-379]|uniref:DUF6455 domain-containing protein n=1 Tax=Aliiroseovarius crassostreae TaxID=154981 RepID=A0A0P7J726_9RHOB|nr:MULTISPECIES: DUF6455 family protein [Aliiroseovarius]KPN64106.1 hypothetical protein AKJ29_15720 [Aliiroseovarius crassostreae]NRP12817.1 hypothetical protein [Aliiroseovarius sp. xm-d-517]NRP24350.1 hypothetical protein [Aliiroseovarius sp. xm-m-379]NRP29838.1 hypothetical protein [Aliiroseovarius sp. xm-m-314]NRP33149.1 hypothetical protein [Aliiroseovarius sp. xm-a-104]